MRTLLKLIWLSCLLCTVVMAQPRGYYRTTTTVNIRAFPKDGEILRVLTPNSLIYISICVDEWCFTEDQSPKGWISARYLSFIYEPAEEPAPDWVTFANANTERFEYYAPLLKKEGNERTLWVKSLPRPGNLRAWQETLPDGIKKTAYKMFQWIFRCADKTIAFGSIAYYDSSGNVLKSYPEDRYPRFSAILPESVSMAAYEVACEY